MAVLIKSTDRPSRNIVAEVEYLVLYSREARIDPSVFFNVWIKTRMSVRTAAVQIMR